MSAIARPRGATLIELCVVLAILGVIAALAVPNLTGMLAVSRGQAEAEAIAGFVDAARQLAVSEGRCVRVRKVGTHLVSERRLTGDCFNLKDQTTVAPAVGAGWEQVAEMTPPPGIVINTPESLGTPPAPVDNNDHRIIFRPSGRLWGNGDVVSDDGARITLQPATGAGNKRAVIITGIGRICTRFHGAAIPGVGTAGAVQCP